MIDNAKTDQKLRCGIIMPISKQRLGMIEYSEEYWASMMVFLAEVIETAGFEPVKVWEAQGNASITPRILSNIRDLPLAICVISSFNPNVMMELGMRLIANKPVLVLCDEHVKSIPFDIKDMEALPIPSRPQYNQYEGIKQSIIVKLQEMTKPGYKTYLDNFRILAPRNDLDEGADVNTVVLFNTIVDKLDRLNKRIESIEEQVQVPYYGCATPRPLPVGNWYNYIPKQDIGPTGPTPLSPAESFDALQKFVGG